MSFQKELKNSFGMVDKIFGGHSTERKHARKMLKKASAEGLDKNEIENKARDYLKSENCDESHITEQIKRINDIEHYI